MTAINFVDDPIQVRAPHCAITAPFAQALPTVTGLPPVTVSKPNVGTRFDATLMAVEARLSGRSRDEVATIDRHFWSQGEPLLPQPPRPRRPIDVDPATMTLQQLMDTQDQEIRTISRTVYDEFGTGALSLDREIETEDGTDCLAEHIGFDSQYYDVLAEVVDADQSKWTPEQREAYAEFSANFVARRGTTPYVTVDPDVADRIDWERQTAQSSQVHSEGLRIENGQLRYFALFGRRLSRTEFLAKRSEFFRRLHARIGRIPSVTQLAEKRSIFAALKANGALQQAWERGKAFAAEAFDDDPDRFTNYDIEAHGNLEDVIDPYVPSMALAMLRADQEIPLPLKPSKRAWSIRRWTVLQRAKAIQAEFAADGSYVAWRLRKPVDIHDARNRDARWHAELMFADDREIGTYGLEPHLPLSLAETD